MELEFKVRNPYVQRVGTGTIGEIEMDEII